MIYSILYLIIGMFFSIYYAYATGKDIDNPDNESPAVTLYLTFIAICWPIFFIKTIIKYIVKYITDEKQN